jgi:hypothetical protein
MRGYRAWRWALAAFAGAAALSGCEPPLTNDGFSVASDQRHYPRDEWDQVVDNYRAFLKGRGGTGVDGTIELADPRGVFKGTAHLPAPTGGGAAGRLVGALDGASTAGKITGTYHGASGKLSIKGIVLTHGRGATGSLCLAYSADALRSDQLFKGKFQILGGTKKEAKLHGSGNFLTLQPNLIKSYNQQFSLYLAAGFKHASVGHARGLSKDCRNAGKPFPAPPPPKDLKASFDGFTFGTAAGTTVYPNGATVSDNATCGQDLFGVFSYSGPAGGAVEGLADNTKFKQKLGQGKNDVRLLPAATDGEHHLKGQITAPKANPVDFFPSLTLSRNC